MPGPKMGNSYPSSISSYPGWVAHATPYTAEWGNSVGFEFYLIEYALGANPQGPYQDVAARLNAQPTLSGFNYWARGYYMQQQTLIGPGSNDVYFEIAEHDVDEVFDLVGRKNVTAAVSGWYMINWTLFIEIPAGVFPCEVQFYITRSRGGIYAGVGRSNLVIERAGWYSMLVSQSVYLDAGEYISATIGVDTNTQVNIRPEAFGCVVDFRLITAEPYDRR